MSNHPTRNDLICYLSENEDAIVTEFLPGLEYTVDCFTDAYGELLFASGRERVITKAGISVVTKMVSASLQDSLQGMAFAINKSIQFVGAWFCQAKHSVNGELCLMEVAPRVSGAMALHRSIGVNFPALSVMVHMNLNVNIPPPIANDGILFKVHHNYVSIPGLSSITTIYCDLDDTLICHNAPKPYVNPRVIQYLYMASAQNKSIKLLTRHKFDVGTALASLEIAPSLFSEVIQISDGSRKIDFITEPRVSALIDDSFHERVEAQSAGILSIDIDM